jgi:heat shock protein beta-11
MELASSAKGATVVVATSFDARHPPDVVLDGRDSTFFTTTGQFPQEMIIKLSESGAAIQSVQTITTNGECRVFALAMKASRCATAAQHQGAP